MSATAAIRAGRRQAEALMVDTWTVTRPGGSAATLNEVTGQWEHTSSPVVYRGQCKIQCADSAPSNPDLVDRDVFISHWSVHVPVTSGGSIREGDIGQITSCPLDPSLVGRTFTVLAPHAASMKTARRLPVAAEVSSWT